MINRIITTFFACMCLTAGAGTLVTDQQLVMPDGTARYFNVYVPDPLPPAAPVVFIFHGATEDSTKVFSASDPQSVWKQVADTDGVILVAPNGTNPLTGQTNSSSAYWNDCTGTTLAGKDTADDIGFVRALAVQIQSSYSVDPTRFYATGMSGGGMMALRVGREAGDLFAAVESTSGLDPVPGQDQCHDLGVPVPLMLVQGDADTLVSYDGSCDLLQHCYSSFASTVAAWLVRNGIPSAVPGDLRVPPSGVGSNNTSVDCQVYAGAGGAVTACTVHNGGHTEPSIQVSLGLTQLLLGKQNRDLETSTASWTFFAAFQR